MLFVDSVHCEVSETLFTIVKELSLFNLILELGIETIQLTIEVAPVETVFDFAVHHFLVCQILNEVVAHLGADKCVASDWRTPFITTGNEHSVVCIEVVTELNLSAAREEFSCTAASLGVLRRTSVAHQTNTLDGSSVDVAAEHS